jgi:hypothetical protein
MATLWVCEEVDAELDELYERHEEAAAAFDALLIELAENARLLHYLCLPELHFKAQPPFEVKRYEAMQRRGFNVLTVKVQTSDGRWPPYRALIGFNAQSDSYHVLAIAHREISYERDDPLYALVLERYERAGIPRYR